jgi:uncharacterized damage-inducible protein DinB
VAATDTRGGLSPTPATDDRAGWLAFVAETRALVGDRDPVALMSDAPARVSAALAAIPAARRGVPEREGAWSATQVLSHLADVEMAWSVRLRQILVMDDYVMDGFDQAAWAAALPYASWDAEASLALFARLRERNLDLWRGLTPAQWQRSARHAHRDGRESLADIARLLAGHDLRHERQLARLRAAVAT